MAHLLHQGGHVVDAVLDHHRLLLLHLLACSSGAGGPGQRSTLSTLSALSTCITFSRTDPPRARQPASRGGGANPPAHTPTERPLATLCSCAAVCCCVPPALALPPLPADLARVNSRLITPGHLRTLPAVPPCLQPAWPTRPGRHSPGCPLHPPNCACAPDRPTHAPAARASASASRRCFLAALSSGRYFISTLNSCSAMFLSRVRLKRFSAGGTCARARRASGGGRSFSGSARARRAAHQIPPLCAAAAGTVQSFPPPPRLRFVAAPALDALLPSSCCPLRSPAELQLWLGHHAARCSPSDAACCLSRRLPPCSAPLPAALRWAVSSAETPLQLRALSSRG